MKPEQTTDARPNGTPSISAIVAVRNGARTLERCLDSLFEQSYDPLEIVVMDGGSTDGTQALLERHSARIAYWESRPDRGIYHAWNKALAHATGDWIFFIGADDRLHASDVMTRLAPSLAMARGRSRVVYGAIDIVDAEGNSIRLGEPWSSARRMFRAGLMLPHAATFHHRELFEERGGFDDRYRIAGDYEFLLRELLDRDPIFVPDLVVVDVGAGGISSQPASDGVRVREKHRARRKHGLVASSEWRSPEVMKAVVRSWITRTFGQRAMERVRDASRRLRGRPTGKV